MCECAQSCGGPPGLSLSSRWCEGKRRDETSVEEHRKHTTSSIFLPRASAKFAHAASALTRTPRVSPSCVCPLPGRCRTRRPRAETTKKLAHPRTDLSLFFFHGRPPRSRPAGPAAAAVRGAGGGQVRDGGKRGGRCHAVVSLARAGPGSRAHGTNQGDTPLKKNGRRARERALDLDLAPPAHPRPLSSLSPSLLVCQPQLLQHPGRPPRRGGRPS